MRRYLVDEKKYVFESLDAWADDFADANGTNVLDFWQAQDRARERAKVKGGAVTKTEQGPQTVGAAVTSYIKAREARSKENGRDARYRLSPVLKDKKFAAKPLAKIASTDLEGWINSLSKTLKPATIKRTGNDLRAALSAAVNRDWRNLPDTISRRDQDRPEVAVQRGRGCEQGAPDRCRYSAHRRRCLRHRSGLRRARPRPSGDGSARLSGRQDHGRRPAGRRRTANRAGFVQGQGREEAPRHSGSRRLGCHRAIEAPCRGSNWTRTAPYADRQARDEEQRAAGLGGCFSHAAAVAQDAGERWCPVR